MLTFISAKRLIESVASGLPKYVLAPAADMAASNKYLARTRLDPRSKLGVCRTGQVAVAILSLSFLLTGCASRPEVGALLANHEMSMGGKDHTILVATTRDRDPRPGTYFGGERSESVSYATITVAVPPAHVPGKIEWPSRAPGNPTTDFVVRDAAYLDSERDFVKALNAQLAMRRPDGAGCSFSSTVTIRCSRKDSIASRKSWMTQTHLVSQSFSPGPRGVT